jgi:hypothetical protein
VSTEAQNSADSVSKATNRAQQWSHIFAIVTTKAHTHNFADIMSIVANKAQRTSFRIVWKRFLAQVKKYGFVK